MKINEIILQMPLTLPQLSNEAPPPSFKPKELKNSPNTHQGIYILYPPPPS